MKQSDEKPLVSVIIPTYNRGWVVEEAIASVLAQDYGALELIVVDDGSTDGTPGILDAYEDKLITIRQKNQGVSAARNRGVRSARGAYIAFLDSDDLWMPRKLSVQMAAFLSHPEMVICQTEEIWIRNGRRVNPKKMHRKQSGMIFERSLALCLVSPSAVMMKKALFDEVGFFDETLPACEDYDLWLRVGRKYPVHLISKALTVKRGGHDDQLSRMPALDRFRIRSIVGLLESGDLTPGQRRAAVRMLREKCRIYALGCEKRGRTDEANTFRRLSQRFHER